MKYFVIRHAETDATRLNGHMFGKEGAPLNDAGILTAKKLHDKLKTLGIDPADAKVAVSELLRTRQTALAAGFPKPNLVVNALLNEVNTGNPEATNVLVSQGKLPAKAIEAAQAIIDNPPKERVWVTHGLVLGALREVLGVPGFIPELGSIVELEIGERIDVGAR